MTNYLQSDNILPSYPPLAQHISLPESTHLSVVQEPKPAPPKKPRTRTKNSACSHVFLLVSVSVRESTHGVHGAMRGACVLDVFPLCYLLHPGGWWQKKSQKFFRTPLPPIRGYPPEKMVLHLLNFFFASRTQGRRHKKNFLHASEVLHPIVSALKIQENSIMYETHIGPNINAIPE